MMPSPLLFTKLHFPAARSNLVPRPRLVERLEAGLQGPLTLLSAPAGFGKTSLLSEWRAGEGRSYPSAWLSLDEGDNDPLRFFVYLTAAFETVRTGLAGNARALLQTPQPPPMETILLALLDELSSFPEHLALVLDDLHVIHDQSIQAALAFLVDHLPTQIHLVILTRADPLLPLARLRARSQLVEIRAEHLRFTLDETAGFLKEVMGLALSPEDIAALEGRSEGWIAGLQLAALSMQGREDLHAFVAAFTGSHHYILDYLSDEVLARQPDPWRTFLLQTSILDEMNGSLCNAVTGRSDGQATLEGLERANLFLTALDDERQWYRYHHLFADMLRSRLLLTKPDQVSDLHRRAAGWLDANGFVAQAISHAMAAGDQTMAAELIDRNAASMLMRGEMVTLLGWIKSVEPLIHERPGLYLAQAWALAFTGQMESARDAIHGIEQQVEAGSPAYQDRAQEILGETAALRAFLAAVHGEPSQAMDYAHQALTLLPDSNLTVRGVVNLTLGGVGWLSGNLVESRQAFAEALRIARATGNIHLAISGLNGLADLSLYDGGLLRAFEMYQESVRLASGVDGQPLPVAAEACTGLGNLSYEWNDLDAAAHYLEQGIQLGRRLGRAGTLSVSLISMAGLRQAQGDLEGAAKLLQEAEGSAHSSPLNPPLESRLAAGKMRLWLGRGELDPAARLVRERGVEIEATANPLYADEALVIGHVLLATRQLEQASRLANMLLHQAEANGQIGLLVGPLILRSLSLKAAGDLPGALAALERGLSLAEPQGYVRTFLDEGPVLSELLRRAAAGDVAPDYAARLLSAMSLPSGGELPGVQPLIEPLSDRELQVLHLVAAGLSNQQIADELVLARGTVKKHLNNIFGKLGAQSRTQCVARARDLHLL